jgi:hypothetical protein
MVRSKHERGGADTTVISKNRYEYQDWFVLVYTVKKGFSVFPFPDGMSLTKLFLDGNMFPLLSVKFSLSQAGILIESF